MKTFLTEALLGILTFDLLICIHGIIIKPPTEEIFSNQLCPEPTTKSLSPHSNSNPSGSGTQMPREVMSINLDKPKDSPHFYESCTFKEQGSKTKQGSTVRVRSINLNVNPWNFSTADNCTSFIKFNNWDEHEGGRFAVLCGRENFDQYLGPYGHPMVLYYQWKNGGLSFPLFHSSYGTHHRDRKETLELNFIQIYFAVLTNNTWKCRVQQYRLDLLRLGCSSTEDDEPVCGEYNCTELEVLYQAKMTIFKDGESDNDTVLVWKSSKSDKYRMRTFLRQKFVPVVFLIVLIFAYRSYMKAGLRFQNSVHDDNIPDIRVRSVRLRRHFPISRPYTSREITESYWNYEEEDPPAYGLHGTTMTVPNDPDNVTNIPFSNPEQNSRVSRPKPTDPPPPYESVCPPTYSEATKP